MAAELPTDPGFYLWAGTRRPENLSFRDLLVPPRVELVRVLHDSKGNLTYIGSDFFYNPKDSIGVWLKIDAADIQNQAVQLCQARFVSTNVAAMRKEVWNRPYGRKEYAGFLRSHVFGIWHRKTLTPEQKTLLDTLVDLAENLGLLGEHNQP